MATSEKGLNDVILKDNILYIFIKNNNLNFDSNSPDNILDEARRAVREARRVRGVIICIKDTKTGLINKSIWHQIRLVIEEIGIDNIAFVCSLKMRIRLFFKLKGEYYIGKMSFFRDEKKAKSWMTYHSTYIKSRLTVFIGSLIILLGFLTIISYAIQLKLMVLIFPETLMITPVVSVCLIIIGLWLIAHAYKKTVLAYVFSSLMLLFGILSFTINTIELLANGSFSKIYTDNSLTWMSSAVFLLVGIISLRLNSRRENKELFNRIVNYIIFITIFIVSLLNLYSQLYFSGEVNQLGSQVVVPISLSIGFILFSLGLLSLGETGRSKGNNIFSMSPAGWFATILIIIVQAIGYNVWLGANDYNGVISNQHAQFSNEYLINLAQSELNSYKELGYMISSFYTASSSKSNVKSLNLTKYPGLSSINYCAVGQANDIKQFVKNNSNNDVITLDSKNQIYGAAFQVADIRNNNFNSIDKLTSQCTDQSDLYSDNTVHFLTNNDKDDKTFLLYIPIKQTSSSTEFVIVNILYKPFFEQAISDYDRQNNFNVKIIDKKTNSVIFNSLVATNSDNTINYNDYLTDTKWYVKITMPSDFGLTSLEYNQTTIVAFIIQIISLLFIVIFIWQYKQKKRALSILNVAAQDLRYEQTRILEINQKDEAIIESIGDGMFFYNMYGKIIIANDNSLKLLGIEKKQDIIGRDINDVVKAYTTTGKLIPQHQRLFFRVLESKKTEKLTMIYKRLDGVVFPSNAVVAPVIINGKIIGAVGLFNDITKEMQLDKAKDELLSLASHQLRTPLTAIKWYIESLLDPSISGKLSDKQLDIVQKIDLSNKRMIELVTILLNVSRIESGRLMIQTKLTDYKKLIESVLQETEEKIKNKKQNIIFNYKADSLEINLDDNLIRQVISNLVVNSNKYSPYEATIEINVTTQGNYVLTTIKDNGYGIPKNQQASVFKKFFRADNAIPKEPNGNGLGLYLVKSIIKESGGRIWFQSEQDKGTTFYFILPIKGVRSREGDVSLEKVI